MRIKAIRKAILEALNFGEDITVERFSNDMVFWHRVFFPNHK